MLPARKVIFKTKVDIPNTEIFEGIHALRLGFEFEGGEVEEEGRAESGADSGKGVEDSNDIMAENAATMERKPANSNRIPPI